MSVHKVAVVQDPPPFLDRAAAIEQVVTKIREATAAGARLVVFGESYLGGYPDWIWRLRPYLDGKVTSEIHARLIDAAVDLETDLLAPVCAAAKQGGATVILGLTEREGRFGRSTLYNTIVTILPTGEIANRHRKLVPTNPERMVWGMGDASGLRVVSTPVGRVGGLICWENYMPLARFALYADGVEIYVAPTWDHGERWRATLVHIAVEGRVWVIGACMAVRARDLPADLPNRAAMYPDDDEWVNPGDSMIVDPFGAIAAGPLEKQRGILYAEIDPARVAQARRTLDVAGHYGRPDVFRLEVNRAPAQPVTSVRE